jgi:paraquat-inducible protein B
MSEQNQASPERDELPEVAVAQRRGISIVWLIPLVAGLIAVWLGYTTIMEQGPTVTITFKTGAGLEAGKTKVKYRDVEVGLVEDVAISKDGESIIVTASLVKGTEEHLTEGTSFWVVRPRLGVGGVSGLGTLVSGAHIAVEPGPGAQTLAFTGLEVPPVVPAYEEGREFMLRAETLGSLSPGSPIYYRGLEVGEVLGYELAGEGRGIEIHIFIKEPHYQLVRRNSRFWNASGVDVSVGAEGFTVSTASVQALLAGGVSFDTPASATEVEVAAEGTSFKLFKDLASVSEATYTEKTPYVAYFDGSVRGLQVGAPVEFRGIRIGSVTDVALEINRRTTSVRIPVTFQVEPQRVNVLDVTGAMVTESSDDPYAGMARLVERGLRAQLQSGSLLTGQLLVALDFHPDSPAAELRTKGRYPEIPTVPSDLEQITQSVEQVLAKVAALPLDELIADLRTTLKSANQTLSTAQSLVGNLDGNVGPLLVSLKETSKAAEKTLVSADGFIGEQSEIRYDLSLLMQELTEAARSIRFLTDYLEQHPEALIRGKGGSEE